MKWTSDDLEKARNKATLAEKKTKQQLLQKNINTPTKKAKHNEIKYTKKNKQPEIQQII